MKIRLHQFLSRTGMFGSKKDLIQSVRSGNVKVNGKVVVNPEFIFDAAKKAVFWNDRLLQQVKKNIYIIVNKPEGFLSSRLTANDVKLGKRSVFGIIDKDKSLDEETKRALFCVGRLDEDTSGLLIITNDGKLGAKLTDPKNKVEKTYLVKLQQPITPKAISDLEKGVIIDLEENGIITKYMTKGCRVEVVSPDFSELKVFLTEGKKREVRRMFEAVGNKVVQLQRVGIGNLRLEELNLKKGECSIADSKLLQLIL